VIDYVKQKMEIIRFMEMNCEEDIGWKTRWDEKLETWL